MVFYTPFVFKLPFPELWRLVTPFLLTGSGFSMLFDLYFSRHWPAVRSVRCIDECSVDVWYGSRTLASICAAG